MATATPEAPRLTRDQMATALLDHLGEEPQSLVSLARALGLPARRSGQAQETVSAALAVLRTRGQAKLIPHEPGTRNGGWTRGDSRHQVEPIEPIAVSFDYDFKKRVPFADWFVDAEYQRPLTPLVKKIAKGFDSNLFGAPMLSDRGPEHTFPARFAIIDGQTRWEGGRRAGVQAGPAQIFTELTVEQESDIFWKIQKHRTGMVSWYRFRAQMRAGDPQSLAIAALVDDVGYELGDGPGKLRSMSALESCFKSDQFQLQRTLSDFRDAWPDVIPEAGHIYGLHFFFRRFPLDSKRRQREDVNDELLVDRLRVAGPAGLARRAAAAKEIDSRGSGARHMAMAIQAAYLSRGKS